MFKKIIFLTCLTITLLFSVSCSEKKEVNNIDTENDIPSYGDTFIEASISDPVTLNPILYTDSASGDIIDYIFNGLIKYDPFRKIVPDMAEKWEIKKESDIIYIHLKNDSKNNALFYKEKFINGKSALLKSIQKINIFNGIDSERKLILELIFNKEVSEEDLQSIKELSAEFDFVNYKYSILFELRKDVKWTDGKDFTAGDVIFTYEKIVDPEIGSPRRSNYKMIKSVSQIDRYNIKVEYFKPFAPALQSWMMNIIPKHILEGQNIIESRFNRKPIGTGYFKLDNWSSDEYILMTSNKEFFRGRPYIDKVMVKNIPDKSQQFLDLKNGLIDYMSMTPDQFKKQGNSMEFEKRFNIFQTPSSTYYSFVGYNCDRKPFDNIEIRKALSYAIDVQAIIDNVFYGMGQKVSGPFPLISWAYNKNAPSFDYNPEKAIELLKEQGYSDEDGDGYLEKDGKSLEIDLITNNGNKSREYSVMIIKDYWEKIGIKCNIKLEEWGHFLHLQDIGDFDAVLLGWSLGLDPDIYNIWHSDNIPNEQHPTSFNFMRYKNDDVDKLLEKARYTFDQEERKKYYHKVHEIIALEQPYTFLVAEDSLRVLDKRFKGVKQQGNSIFYNFEKWFVPKCFVKYK